MPEGVRHHQIGCPAWLECAVAESVDFAGRNDPHELNVFAPRPDPASMTLNPENSEIPEPDASIRATALLYWQDPEELEMRTRELLRLKERLWQIPFYREALGVPSGAHFLMGWHLSVPLQRID